MIVEHVPKVNKHECWLAISPMRQQWIAACALSSWMIQWCYRPGQSNINQSFIHLEHHVGGHSHDLVRFLIEKIVVTVLLHEASLALLVDWLASAYVGCIHHLLILQKAFKFYLHDTILIVFVIDAITLLVDFLRWPRMRISLHFFIPYLRDIVCFLLFGFFICFFILFVFERLPSMNPALC